MHKQTLLLLVLSILIVTVSSITPSLFLPIQSTKGLKTQYSFGFTPEASVPHSAKIRVIFPFEFDPRALITFTGCKLQRASGDLIKVPCTISNRTFTLDAGTIAIESLMVVIGNIQNPTDTEMSSQFAVQTMFKDVIVQANSNFGRTPFTSIPVDRGTTMTVNNYENTLVDRGSSWVFQFTLSKTYPINSTIRFVFPQGFSTLKVQCNITGVSDANQQTRVFPNGRVYDCLNIKSDLVVSQKVIVSGVMNPNYQMTVSTIQAHILQPNSIVVLEKIKMNPASPITIARKDMNATITIPNMFRNNTLTYIFEINMDSDLYVGDYMQLKLTGNWTYFISDSAFIEGINSNASYTPVFQASYSWPTSSILEIRNFSSIKRSSQIAFYVSLRTPLTASTYTMTLSAFRSSGGLVEQIVKPVQINATTGYIREMRLHPMVQTIKLPVGKTGPLQFTLGLMNNLPQTNVLTYGKLVIKITPNLPLPDMNVNGVPKCYFYGTIEAKNCTYDATNPSYTVVTAYTPIDYNFQSSQVPFMITTEGYIDPQYEGITIDSLVKRYHFHVQFYTNLRPEPIPTEVIFGDWVADPVALAPFTCTTMNYATSGWDHLQCTFTTPSEDLCQPGYFHFFRLEFTFLGGYWWTQGWESYLGYNSNHVYPDYPCIAYGTNLTANPYVKCDLVTWLSGPYASELSKAYVNIYGFELLPAGSTITVEIPRLKRMSYSSADIAVRLTVLQDTWGYQTDYITLYSRTQGIGYTYNIGSICDSYLLESVTYTLTNSIINKVTDISLPSYDLTQSGVTHIVLEVDQTKFQDIGRGHHIACGSHLCSKFNKPIQYFILHPSTALTRYETLTFPSIVTPDYAGSFEFRIRVYKNNACIKHSYFNVVINPETMAAPTYTFYSALESESVIYPKTDHFYSVTFVTKNPLPAATSYVQITINNYFSLVSDYCVVVTTAPANDTRGIQCETWVGENKIYLQNLGQVPAATSFTVSIQLRTTSSSSTLTPTVSIITYHSPNNKVDQVLNAPFATPTLTNTNLQTFTSFVVANPQKIERKITKGYFGHLVIKFKPRLSTSVTIGYYLKLTFTNNFYPYSNQLNLPLRCTINGVRLKCSYTLSPFVVTIEAITNKISESTDNIVNITTEYLDHNGIFHPASQGRYLIEAQISNDTNTEVYENVQQYVDVLPGVVPYFNVSYAHRDIGRDNIFEVKFRTGSVVVPAYNDATTAGRIYIGFPTLDDASAGVFPTNLGFSSGLGTVVPCWFQTGSGYISALSGKNLTCKLRNSPFTPNYAYVQITNFNQLPANTNIKLIMAKIANPSIQKYDVNFLLRINSMSASTKEESALYQSYFNMFFNMLSPSITSRSETDPTTTMFEPGARVGDYGKYINNIPYTGAGSFSAGDWYIVNMHSEFPLNGLVGGCMPIFYQYCLVFREINWLAVKIGNTSLLPLQIYVDRLPTSIVRDNSTTYQAYTFKSERWSEIITYTVTQNYRWRELRGDITDFTFSVLGSQDKLNINQKNVDVMVTFKTTHIIYRGGSIEIKFPTNPTLVPNVRPHCRSFVTSQSELQGDSALATVNKQGDVGCLVQNDYSWVITSFDQLAAGSKVQIVGSIDLPTVQTSTLGMGFIVSYSNTHSSNVFANGRIIDYLTTNFPLQVNNKTWSLDPTPTMYKSEPLRVSHKGEIKFKLKLASNLNGYNNGGYITLNLWRYSIFGLNQGFNGTISNCVCKIKRISNNERFGCIVSSTSAQTNYLSFTMQSIETLTAGIDYEITLTTQNGNANEGMDFPVQPGVYKIETIVFYTSGSTQEVSEQQFIEVYGPDFRVLNFISTISTPGQSNFIIVEVIPPVTIYNTYQQLVIEIPTSTVDGTPLFLQDLGMGYDDYDDLVFDLFESTISSMTCKVYTGDKTNNQPVKIVCSSFNINLDTTTTVKFGFWTKNPSTSIGLAIPVQVYSFEPNSARKFAWSIVQAAIKVLPTSATAISDLGNFLPSSTQRQISGVHFDFTTRNTKALTQNDLYILKFNFDLRMSQKYSGSFKYNTGFANSGDVIFMRNCKTVILRVGASSLSIIASGSTTKNARIDSSFYNPFIQLSTSESKITAYAIYLSTGNGEIINHNDAFPALVPRQMSSPSFSITALQSNLNKGSPEDYLFSFTYSTASSATDMALVKKISIQFPPYGTYDYTFAGSQCMEHSSSAMEIQDCFIDTTSYTIWITPKEKAYINSNNFQIETKGLSIINPINNATIYLNKFVVKFYTWVGSSVPALYASTDDYVFFKQDSTYISGASTITYTGTYYDKHTDVKFSRTQYINEFEPAHSDIGTNRAKTPLEFVFKAMAAFNLQTTNYHQIRLTFSSYYTHDTLSQSISDLYFYVPTCHLNGVRIHYCVILGGKIIMRFQQELTLGQEVAVRFSVLNPKNEADDGFTLINANNPTVTVPIEFYPYGGSSYYAEPEKFHTYQKASGTYPQLGIYSAILSAYGNTVFSKLNYLEFSLSFSRSDINGLVLQIPVMTPDGTIIYSDPTLLNLPSGSQYPCSVGINANVYCYYEKGSTSDYGRPTRIYITQFASTTSLSLRILFTNPDKVGMYPNFIFKAFGGTITAPNLMGSELMGRYQIIDPYMIQPELGFYSTGPNYSAQPNKNLYNRNTIYSLYISEAQNANSYVILEWPLTNGAYGDLSQYVYQSPNTLIADYFIIPYSSTNRMLYLVKKLAAYYSGTGSDYFQFGYLRQKHFLTNSFNVYLMRVSSLRIVTVSVSLSWLGSNLMANWGGASIESIDVSRKTYSTQSWFYVSISLSNTYVNFDTGTQQQHSDLVLVLRFTSGAPHSSFNGSTYCSIEDGVIGYNKLKPVTCELDSTNNQIIMRNIGRVTAQQVRVYYHGTTIGSGTLGPTAMQARLYANTDAFNDGNWCIYKSTTTGYAFVDMYYYQYTSYSQRNIAHNTGGGSNMKMYDGNSYYYSGDYTQIISVSSTQIVIRLRLGSGRVFNDYYDHQNAYRMQFRFYTERLTPGYCNSVSMTSSRGASIPSTAWSCQGQFSRHFYAIKDFWNYDTYGRWPDWQTNQYYDFTFSFTSVSGDVNNQPQSLYASATLIWYTSQDYYQNQPYCLCQTSYASGGTCCLTGYYSSYYGQHFCTSTSTPYSCRWYYGIYSLFITGTNQFYRSSSLANALSVDLLSNQRGVETELIIKATYLRKPVTSSASYSFLLFHFDGGQTHSNNNPFPATTYTDQAAYIDCKCLVGNSLSITASTTYLQPTCIRYVMPNFQPSVGVYVDVAAGQDLWCYFPGYIVSTSTNPTALNVDMFLIPNSHFNLRMNSQYYAVWATYDASTNYRWQYTSSSISVSENGFWSSSREALASVMYDVNYTIGGTLSNPAIYIADIGPIPSSSFCSSGYLYCRTYTSFMNRRYYIVAQVSGSTNIIRFNLAAYYPPSVDYNSNYYTRYVGIGQPGDNYYYRKYSSSRGMILYPASTGTNYQVDSTLYGTTLSGRQSGFIISADLSGKKLYSNKATYGQYQGSFIRVSFNGFSDLSACGATLSNRLFSIPAPLYCEYKSSNTLQIRTRQDISISGILYITIFTSAIPDSTTYTLQLYDKYISSSDYAKSVYLTKTISRYVSGFIAVQPTKIKWRRQVYREYQTSNAPIRFTLNNNYQYVYDEANSANSDAIIVYYQGGIVSGYKYACFIKEYSQLSRHLYRDYEAVCEYYTTDTVRIQSIPSHVISPNYYYEITVYRNDNGATMGLALSASNYFLASIKTHNALTSPTVLYQDFMPINKYYTVYPIVLNQIYILTNEASATNSLLLNFAVNTAGVAYQYLEFEFNNLGLSSFQIANGDIITCYLSGFSTIGGKTIAPLCRGYTNGLNQDSPLIIRVQKFASFASGTTFSVAFNEFSNPAVQTLYMTPINVRISLVDRTNAKIYTSKFLSVYASDSINRGVPTALSGSWTKSNSNRGASGVYHYFPFNWPYTSNVGDISQKLVLKIGGGITCCNAFTNFIVDDNQAGTTYTRLWYDTIANISVYQIPTIASGTSISLRINSVKNPYPIQKETYEQIKKVQFLFYNNYKNAYIKQVDQHAYSTYTQLSQITVSNDLGLPIYPPTASYHSHQNYQMTYDFDYTFSLNSFAGRGLSYTILNFTSGAQSIEKAYIRYQISPFVVSPYLDLKIFKDGFNCWCIKIPGMNDNVYSTSNKWIVRVRFYPSSVGTLSYTSTTYAANGQIQFSNSNSESLTSDGFQIGPISPTTFELFEKSYTNSYFLMQRKWMYATSGLTTKKLQFRFTTPYAISQVESFSIVLPTLTTMIPQNSPGSLFCVIQPTVSQGTTRGIGLYSPCSYAVGTYTINSPIGGLSALQEYTISIIEQNQTSTTFTMPTSPDRYEVSFIYNSNLALKFGDTYILQFAGLMSSFSVSHLSYKKATSNMIGFTFVPSFTLAASSRTPPVTESVLEIQFENRYFADCLGVDTVYSGDGMTFQSGVYFTHYASPSSAQASTRLICGQYSESFTPAKIRVTDFGQFLQGTTYYFRFPLIMNPTSVNNPFVYKIRLLSYANSNYFPKTLGYYEYNNLQMTVNGNAYETQYTALSVSNAYVQSSMSLTFYYDNYYPPSGTQIAVKFKNNALAALSSVQNLAGLTNANLNYAYEYYPNINLCIFKKLNSNSDKTMSMGTLPTTSAVSSFTISWANAYQDSSNIYYSNFYYALSKTISTTHKTSWDSSSFTKDLGLLNTNSMGIYTVAFSSSSLSFPEGSYMILTFSTYFTLIDDYCKTMSGFVQGATLSTSNLLCRKISATQIQVAGYNTIAAGSSLSISLYLQIALNSLSWTSSTVNVKVYSSSAALIIDANTNAFSLNMNAYGSYNLQLLDYMEQYIEEDTSQELDFTFTLASHTLGNGDYVTVYFGNWTIDPALTEGKTIWKYKVGNNIYWVPTAVTIVSGNTFKIPVNQNYSMTVGQQISVKVFHELPDAYNGAYFSETQWSYLKIEAYNSANTRLEHQYIRLWIEPYQHTSLQVSPILTFIGATTVYEFAFSPNVSAAVGDVISVEFTTNDGYQTSLFSETLGRTIYTNSSFEMSCHQWKHAGVITPSSNPISCEMFKGDATANPPIPTTVQIPIRNAIAANNPIKFNILNVLNPSISAYPIGITVKLMNICDRTDQNNLCTYYKSTKYIYFATLSTSIPSLYSSYGSLSFSPNVVSATNAVHTFTGSYTVSSGDYLRIVYYPQVTIPKVCTLSSSNGFCYSYPIQNTIIIVANTTQTGSYTFSLSGMTNLYQSRASELPSIQIWSASTGLITGRHQPTYWVSHITADPTTGLQPTITFTPTLTPNYQLKYGFNNIARVEISYLLQNDKIQMIYLTAPSGITIAPSYCNATLESTTAEASPYPYRFECWRIGSSYLQLIKQDNFPAWTPAFINKKIVIYLQYIIADWVTGTSGSWDVNTYTYITASPSTWYRVSQGWGSFPITQYQSPYIYKINFPTQAFSKRTCRTNQLCMFYGYLLPSTLYTDIQIRYMTYTLPREFGYSNITSYSSCKMEEKNNDFNPITCTANRSNSDVILKFYPNTYNHKYKLVTIDASDKTKLFKAPAYPGNHYQMKVNLFTSADVLVESMMVNLTTVYGDLLDYNYLLITIPKDADQLGLFQFKFKVGTTDILPGYENSASNRITSKIQFEFSKSFADDLGTGKNSGDEVACLAISGLTLSSTGKLTCKIYPSYSTTTYPRIQVSGYDRILANTDNVIIRIAKLKTLPAGKSDYIKIGVSLTYYDYGGVKGYVYEPTGFVVGGTTALAAPVSITLSVTESSTNFVGQLVNYTFSGTLGGGFATVTTNDYIGIEFADNVFEGVFSLNPKALCSLAASSACLSFGLSKLIYFKPSAAVSSSALNFNLNNIINTAFSFEYINTTYKVFTLVDNKVNAVGTASLIKFSKPSTNASAIITKVDSLYGGESGITYYFELKLNSNLPKSGLISIQFPDVYDSLFNLNSACILSSDFPWGSYCEVVSPQLVVIRPNGNLLKPTFTYAFTMTNITNPNMKLTNYSFIITTQHNDNIYNRLIISRSKFAGPEINVITVKSCTTFEVIIAAHNAFFETVYDISLICPSYIKEASELRAYLSWNPDPTQGECSSATDSLYSYQCAVAQEYQLTTKLTYLSLYMKSISPQKLISIKAKVKNGMIGTYKLVANVSYKGFTYLSTTSNSFFINSDAVSNLSNSQMTLKNYPTNRAYDAVYTIKMPKPTTVSSTAVITDIYIELPPEISEGKETFVCGSLSQTFFEDYFSLILNKYSTPQICSMANKIVKLQNVTSLLSGLGTDDFLRFSFYKLKNANISTTNITFKVSFLDSSTGSGNVLSSGSVSFPSSVSSPPSNLQINKIQTASHKLLVSNLYSFNLTTVTGEEISVNSLSKIGLIVNFPNQYKQVWNRIETMPTITIVFTNALGVSVTYTIASLGVNGTLLATYNIPTAFKFQQAIVSFNFVNPSKSLNCSSTPVFGLSFLDFKKNSIIAQTLGNNIECPEFTDKLYQVNISGNSYMEAGSVYDYTISIEKPALYLKITPSVPTSAISFEPSVITFSSYNETIKTFKVKVSTGLTGTFKLSFVKFQGTEIFYNDIPSFNITAIASTKNYSVTFTSVDVKSIGLPIEIQSTLEVENSKQFTLVYTHNCSSSYSFNPVSFKNLAVGTKNTSISVTYSGSTIPSMCVLDFSISSVTANNYVLSTPRLYISASKSIDRGSVIPAMRMQISPNYRQSESVGATILTNQTQKIKPVLYNLTEVTVGANSAKFLCSSSEPGTIYFAVMKIGTNRNKVLQQEIYNGSVGTGVSYGSSKTGTSGQISTIQSNITAKGLSAQTTYLMGAYVNTSVGISDIKFEVFHTKKSSNGAAMTISFTSIESNADIISALSRTLRIESDRINVMTMREVLTRQQSQYDSSVMNSRSYVFDIVVGPNSEDDSVSAIDVLKQFTSSDYQIKKLKQFLPSFVTTYSWSTREIILAMPKFRDGQQISIPQATFESVKVQVRLWEQAYVYAVIVPTPSNNLLSAQVAQGYDQDNNKLATQYYQFGLTDSAGLIELGFTLLKADTNYRVFVTAECVVPYKPRQRIPDEAVRSVEVKTGVNLNLKGNEQVVIAKVKQLNPELAKAVEQHINDMKNKKKTSPNSQSGYTNTQWWEKQGRRRVIKKINN